MERGSTKAALLMVETTIHYSYKTIDRVITSLTIFNYVRIPVKMKTDSGGM